MYEFQSTNLMGYKLYNFGSWWEIHSPERGKFRGTYEQVVKYSIDSLGFNEHEFRVAKEQMELQFHNASEFGIYKKFMFTFEAKYNEIAH